MAVAVGRFQLHPQPGLPVVQFGPLRGVLGLIDLAVHAKVEQRSQFRFYLIVLPSQFFAMLAVVMLPGVGTGTDNIDEPRIDAVLRPERSTKKFRI